jgi:hypothetical protein
MLCVVCKAWAALHLEGVTNACRVEFTSTDRVSEAQLFGSNNTNYSRRWRTIKAVETSWVAYALRRLQSVGRSSLEAATNARRVEFTSMDRASEARRVAHPYSSRNLFGGWRTVKAVETSWVAYALRRLQSVGRSSS